jgi:hypothetical protein
MWLAAISIQADAHGKLIAGCAVYLGTFSGHQFSGKFKQPRIKQQRNMLPWRAACWRFVA